MARLHLSTVVLLEDHPVANGFTQRYDEVERALATMADVDRVTCGPPGSGADLTLPADVFDLGRRGRLLRFRAALGLGGPFRVARRAIAAATAASDGVLFFAYRHPEFAGLTAKRCPTWMFIEERPRAMGDTLRFTRRSRVLATAERSAMRALLGPVEAVVVIHRGEVDAAEQRWKKPVAVVPHAVDRSAVSTTTPLDQTTPGSVLIVGNLTERRNAEGLRALLDALSDVDPVGAVAITAVSATGVDEALAARHRDRLTVVGPVRDLRPLYDATRIVCVPAAVAWGVKTTILQGWAARRPVVTTTASAATVDAVSGEGLVATSNAQSLALALIDLSNDLDRCSALVVRGAALLEERHSDAAVASAVDELLRGHGGR